MVNSLRSGTSRNRVRGLPHSYEAYGLNLASNIDCPELCPSRPTWTEPDITIRVGPVPEFLPDPRVVLPLFQAAPGAVLLTIPAVARYLVLDGVEIYVDPLPDVDESSIRLFLLGSALAAAMQQRRMLVLHGSVMNVGGSGVAFLGHSGMGKSSIAARLQEAGHEVLSDDVCAFEIDTDGPQHGKPPLSRRGLRHLKLWEDGCHRLGLEPERLRRVRPEDRKFSVPLATPRPERDLPRVERLYVLEFGSSGPARIDPIEGTSKLAALIEHSYRREFLGPCGLDVEHLRQCAALAAVTPMYRIRRPKDSSWNSVVSEHLAELSKQSGTTPRLRD